MIDSMIDALTPEGLLNPKSIGHAIFTLLGPLDKWSIVEIDFEAARDGGHHDHTTRHRDDARCSVTHHRRAPWQGEGRPVPF